MAKCPVCQTENAADFGLVNCTSCGSPFFVEIDGSASSAVAAPPSMAASPPTSAVTDDVHESPANISMLDDFGSAPPSFASEGPASIPTAEFESLVEAGEQLPPPPMPPIEDLRGIADFGNSEASLAREGAYRFTLYIGGIDTAEIRQEIRFQLSDSRFLWDIDALLATIKEGDLIINDVSAVKAALAIQRLKLLPVELKWEQHAIHQNH